MCGGEGVRVWACAAPPAVDQRRPLLWVPLSTQRDWRVKKQTSTVSPSFRSLRSLSTHPPAAPMDGRHPSSSHRRDDVDVDRRRDRPRNDSRHERRRSRSRSRDRRRPRSRTPPSDDEARRIEKAAKLVSRGGEGGRGEVTAARWRKCGAPVARRSPAERAHAQGDSDRSSLCVCVCVCVCVLVGGANVIAYTLTHTLFPRLTHRLKK